MDEQFLRQLWQQLVDADSLVSVLASVMKLMAGGLLTVILARTRARWRAWRQPDADPLGDAILKKFEEGEVQCNSPYTSVMHRGLLFEVRFGSQPQKDPVAVFQSGTNITHQVSWANYRKIDARAKAFARHRADQDTRASNIARAAAILKLS